MKKFEFNPKLINHELDTQRKMQKDLNEDGWIKFDKKKQPRKEQDQKSSPERSQKRDASQYLSKPKTKNYYNERDERVDDRRFYKNRREEDFSKWRERERLQQMERERERVKRESE